MSELTMKRVVAINADQKRVDELRRQLCNIKHKLLRATGDIEECLERKYTGWFVFLQFDAERQRWDCVGTYNEDELPEDLIWDLCLPIPDPESVPEFTGF